MAAPLVRTAIAAVTAGGGLWTDKRRFLMNYYYDDEPLAVECAACGDIVVPEELDSTFGQGDVCKECVEGIRADFEVFTRD